MSVVKTYTNIFAVSDNGFVVRTFFQNRRINSYLFLLINYMRKQVLYKRECFPERFSGRSFGKTPPLHSLPKTHQNSTIQIDQLFQLNATLCIELPTQKICLH